MAEGYHATLSAAVANPRSIGMLIGATTRRAYIDAITISCQGAPADNTLLWTLQRFTASGTATAKVGTPKDPLGPAATCTTEENATIEPTYTADKELLDEGMNQRSLARFVYAPGKEIMTNITSDNGVGMKVLHASATPVANFTVEWAE